MPDYLHRTSKQFLQSVPVDELPEAVGNYIEEPDMSAVVGEPSKYWIITGDIVTLMDQAAQDAVDAQISDDLLTADRQTAADVTTNPDPVGMQNRELIEVFNQRDNYLVNRIVELQNALDAMKASSGNAQNTRDAIPASWLATQTRPRSDAVQEYQDDILAGGADT